MKENTIRRAALWTVLAVSAPLAGCGSFAVIGAEAKLPEGEESPGFLDRMSGGTNVSENDALRGMLMLIEDQDPCRTFGERVDRLRGKGTIPGNWQYRADRPLTKGRMAYMVYQACNVPGGVILRLTGPSQRYCLRELQYRGMMSSGSWYSPVTGMEYIAVLTRADSYRRTGKVPHIMRATRSE